MAAGHREMACVNAMDPLPIPPATLVCRYIPKRETKLAAIRSYMKLVPYLLPTDDPSLMSPHLWHTDLHHENIFVDPDNPSKITSIIDWQGVNVEPLFEHAIIPSFLDYDGPDLEGIEKPLAQDTSNMTPDEAARAQKLYWEMTLAYVHRKVVYHQNKKFYRALNFCATIAHDLLATARNLLLDGEAIYQERVATELPPLWDTLPAVKASKVPPAYPLTFSESELASILSESRAMTEGICYLNAIKEDLGELYPHDGTVPHAHYEFVEQRLEKIKIEALQHFARNDTERETLRAWWPFDQHLSRNRLRKDAC